MKPDDAKERPDSTLVKFRWPLVLIAISLMALIAYLVSLWMAKRAFDETVTRGGAAGRYAAQKAEAMAAKFMQGTITRTFLAAIPEIASTGGGNLELAKSDQTEIFRTEDSKTILWDKIALGKTVSEIRVPVTYRYHLQLSAPWRLQVSGQTCIVIAPSVHPTLPPAIHTDKMEKYSESGWGRFNASDQMAELEKSITPTLSDYAGDPKHLSLVREECRKTVAEFVRTWLLKEDHWRHDRFHSIKVIFADEVEKRPGQMEPTIQLK